jgi:hypothetical protein
LKFSSLAPYAVATAFNGVLVAGRLHDFSYDASTHVFFASHYRMEWFNLWDTRWYGGFSVAGYSPLSHQLMALLSYVSGLDLSFGILTIIALVFLIWSFQSLASTLDLRSAVLPWLLAFAPGLYLFMYSFGQLPALLSTAFGVAAASYLVLYVEKGGWRPLALSVLLASLSFFTHHLVSVSLAPLMLVVALSRARGLRSLRRIVTWGVIAAAVSAPILMQIINFVLTTPSQALIPHPSRGDVLVGSSSGPFFWGIYGPVIALAPVSFMVLLQERKRAMAALTAAYLVFGLGGTTPIPELVLGSYAYDILTFEKFSLWACLLMIIPLGYYLEHGLLRDFGRRAKGFKQVIFASFVVASLLVLYLGAAVSFQPPPPNLQGISSYLDVQTGDGFYITLGLGTWSRTLSIMTSHPTLDGGYNTARRIPLLAESGSESIDSAKFFPGGFDLVDQVLKGNYGIRWVVLGDSVYEPYLVANGFIKVREIAGALPVSIWTRGGYEEGFKETMVAKDETSYVWGLLPITALALAALIAVRKTKAISPVVITTDAMGTALPEARHSDCSRNDAPRGHDDTFRHHPVAIHP